MFLRLHLLYLTPVTAGEFRPECFEDVGYDVDPDKSHPSFSSNSVRRTMRIMAFSNGSAPRDDPDMNSFSNSGFSNDPNNLFVFGSYIGYPNLIGHH